MPNHTGPQVHVCKTCGHDRRESTNKNCRACYMHWWYHQNPDKGRANVARSEARRRESGKAQEYHRGYFQENREKWRAGSERRRVPGPLRESYLQYLTEWRARNPNSCREWYHGLSPARKTERSSKQYARRKNSVGFMTGAEWVAICKKQRGLCGACKKKRKLTVDHIIPVAAGGSSYACNIQGLCRSCNSRKKHHLESGVQHTIFDK